MDYDAYEAEVPADPQLMALPHPIRVPAAQPAYVQVMSKMLKPAAWSTLSGLFRNNSLMTSDILGKVIDQPGFEPLRRLVQLSARLPGGSEVGNLYGNMLCVRQAVAPQPYFRIDDTLCELLVNTDLDDDIPLDVLKAPYPRFYVEFGQSRKLPLHLPNHLSGEHILEGAYVEVGTREEVGRGLYVLLTASPLGKRNALDDATHAVFLPLEKHMSLQQAIHWSFDKGNENAREHGLITPPVDTLAPALECLNFLAKTLLYIGLPEARRSVHPDRTQWQKSHSALKSTAKRSKAERKGRQLVDYILISAPTSQQEEPRGMDDTRKGPKPHWRRGHYRMQAHGPQHSLRKLTFISPLLVNASDGSTVETAPEYRVR